MPDEEKGLDKKFSVLSAMSQFHHSVSSRTDGILMVSE